MAETIPNLADAPVGTVIDRERIRGWEFWREARRSVLAHTFGRLVELAAVTEHYKSDLFYDVVGMEAFMPTCPHKMAEQGQADDFCPCKPKPFLWSCDEWGTGIGPIEHEEWHTRKRLYRVDITGDNDNERTTWYLTITRLR